MIYIKYVCFFQNVGGGVKCGGRKLVSTHCVSSQCKCCVEGAVVYPDRFLFVGSHCALMGKVLAAVLVTQCQCSALSPKYFHQSVYCELDFSTEQRTQHFIPLLEKNKLSTLKLLPWVDSQYLPLTICLKISPLSKIKFAVFGSAFN